MIQITIIGSGNVALHLINAFKKTPEIEVLQVYCRDKKKVLDYISPDKIIDTAVDLKPADLFIIAVSDQAIASVSSLINIDNQLVVHTSGGMDLTVLDSKHRRGVFYPLQSFSKNSAVDFKEIPICLEAQSDLDYYFLEKVAQMLSNKIYSIDSKQRKSLHLAAVFVNNFVNHLYHIGQDICITNKIDFDVLKPLIAATAQKITTICPKNAQTGPAKRNDNQVIESHLNLLTNLTYKKIYTILTQSIQQNG